LQVAGWPAWTKFGAAARKTAPLGMAAGGILNAGLKNMKTSLHIKAILVAAVGFLPAAGCVVHEQPVYTTAPAPGVSVGAEVAVDAAPPAPMVDAVVAAPGPGFVWIGGAWFWGGGRWVWQGGHWARPPHPGAVWVPHRYVYRNGRHVWVRGGWR
jgi:hypothetical protein